MYTVSTFADSRFTLIGTVYKEINNSVLELKIEDNYSPNKYTTKYTTTIKDGKFSFTGTIRNISEYATLRIVGKGINYFHYLIVDSGTTVFTILPVSAHSPTFKNKLSNIKFVNSPSNELLSGIDNLTTYYYTHLGTPTQHNSTILRLTREKIIELDSVILNRVLKYPSSLSALIILYQVANRYTVSTDRVWNTFNLLNKIVVESDLGKVFYTYLMHRKSVEIGNHIVEFSSKDSKDSIFSNKTLAGKPYLIAFGATWCKPCKENYPALKKIYEKYKSAGFEIVNINLDDQKQTWLEQIHYYALPWIHLSPLKKMEETNLTEIFNVRFLPYYILVDKQGVIQYNSTQLKDYEIKDLEFYVFRAIK
jgi:thiol-disulfide isomerase/thioredoxin